MTVMPLPLSNRPTRVPVFIRVAAGSPVMACCPTVPGLCVIGASISEVTRAIRQRLREAFLADPDLLTGTSVTLLTLDVFSDQVEASTVLQDLTPTREPRDGE